MMVPKVFFGPAYITTSPTDLSGLVPTAQAYVIKNCLLTNLTAGAITVTFYIASDTPGAAATITSISVPANTSMAFPDLDNLVIGVGNGLWAMASAATSVTAAISGFVFS